MARQNNIAIFDIGKTRSKLAVIASDDSLAFTCSRNNQSIDSGRYTHLDVEGTWQWMLQSLARSNSTGPIRDCVVVTHGATFALLSGADLALPVVDYEFDGYASINAEYDKLRDDFSHTYSPALPAGLNAGRQLFWLQRSFPAEFDRVTSIVPYPQYWAARLCNQLASEVTSLGCHTDLWRSGENRYSNIAIAQKWAERIPARRNAWDNLANISPSVADSTGLDPECRILCGLHDSNASYLSHLVDKTTNLSVVSTGTWVVCMAGSQSLTKLSSGHDTLANVDVFGQPVPCARFMGGREYALIAGAIKGADITEIEHAHQVMDLGSFALPSFVPASGPFPGKSGRIINAPAGPQRTSALASLYCALMTDYCLDLLGATGDLVIEGRYVKDVVYVEALSHFRSAQLVLVSDDATGTIRGAARLANWPTPAPPRPKVVETSSRNVAAFLVYRNEWRRQL